jgi:hypothetical protein
MDELVSSGDNQCSVRTALASLAGVAAADSVAAQKIAEACNT